MRKAQVPKLAECPEVHHAPLRPGSPEPVADALKIFEDQQTTNGLARAHTARASICFAQQKMDEAIHHAELNPD